jgi:hypothetical protein
VRGVSRVHGLSALGVADGQPLDLPLDTLRIDGDEERCTVVCRRSFPVADEAALAAVRVVAGIQIAGEAIAWPDPRALVRAASISSSSSAQEQVTAAGTRVLSPEGQAPAPGGEDTQRAAPPATLALAQEQHEATAAPALPFQPAPPPTPIPPAPPRAKPGNPVFTGTLALPPEVEDLVAVERALPFQAQASPSAEPALLAPISAGQGPAGMDPAPEAATPFTIGQQLAYATPPEPPAEAAPHAPAPLPPMPSGVEPLKPPEPAPPPPETPAAAPEPEPAPPDLPIERFAAISAEIAEGRAPRAEVLRAHELTEPAWAAVERSWAAAIAEDGANGSGALRRGHDGAYVAAVEGFRGPITAAEYARILAGMPRGRANQVLDDLRIQRPALMPIIRVWTQKVAADAKLVDEVGAALAAARRA